MKFNGKDMTVLGQIYNTHSVLYVPQELTEEQKAQARANMGVKGWEMPVFDLAAMGLAAVPLAGGSASIAADTAAIRAALDKGSAAFVIPFDAYGMATVQATVAMNGASTDGAYQCVAVVSYGELGTLAVNIDAASISVEYHSFQQQTGVPAVTASDNGKVLQVVNGAWSAVAVADSSIATFVDDYINSALEGDY